jgi:hypothetical protein
VAPAPPGTDVLGTAYNLLGTGLLPWTASRRGFAAAYRSLLARQNIGLASSTLTYVGSVGFANSTAARRRAMLQARTDNVTVYYNIGGVPTDDIDSTATALNTSSTLAAFRTLLVQNGLDVTSLRLVATQEGGITLTAQANAPPSGGGGGLSGGAIAGIVIGVLVGVLAALLLAYLCIYRSRKQAPDGSDSGGVAPYYVTPATPVGLRTAEPFDHTHSGPMGPPTVATAGSSGYSANNSGAQEDGGVNGVGGGYGSKDNSGAAGGYDVTADGTPPRSSEGQSGAASRWNPAQRISSWWDERVRGQTTSNYGVRLGEPQEEFDPYAPSLGESGAPTSPRRATP